MSLFKSKESCGGGTAKKPQFSVIKKMANQKRAIIMKISKFLMSLLKSQVFCGGSATNTSFVFCKISYNKSYTVKTNIMKVTKRLMSLLSSQDSCGGSATNTSSVGELFKIKFLLANS
jgi:hypothetical protein